MNSSYTFRLVKELPSFKRGFTAMFDATHPQKKFKMSATEIQADNAAILADWNAVGKDLKDAIIAYDKSAK